MKKYTKILVFTILLLVAIIKLNPLQADAAFMLKAPPSHYDKGVTISEASKSNKPMAVVFYADWCSACRKFVPETDKYKKVYKGKYEFVLVNVDNPANKKLIEEYYVASLPSVYLIRKKNNNIVYLNPAIYNSTKLMVIEFDRFLRLNK